MKNVNNTRQREQETILTCRFVAHLTKHIYFSCDRIGACFLLSSLQWPVVGFCQWDMD